MQLSFLPEFYILFKLAMTSLKHPVNCIHVCFSGWKSMTKSSGWRKSSPIKKTRLFSGGCRTTTGNRTLWCCPRRTDFSLRASCSWRPRGATLLWAWTDWLWRYRCVAPNLTLPASPCPVLKNIPTSITTTCLDSSTWGATMQRQRVPASEACSLATCWAKTWLNASFRKPLLCRKFSW